MAKLTLEQALSTALTRTKQYIDDNHYNESEINALLALKADKTHGYHVPTPEAAQNNKFLRNDNTWYTVTLEDLGAAAASHGTHVTYSTTAPAANSGSGGVGTAATVARSDHYHPVQTSVSGNAGSANKVNKSITVQLNGGTTEDTNKFTFDGSTAKTINITPANIGASASGHTHDDRYYTETEINSKINTLNTAISTAQTAAQTYADNKITALVDSAPDAMNTLNELATAITNNKSTYDAYVTTVNNALAGKAPTSHASSATTYGVSSDSNYGHAKASSTTPKVAGTAALGSETSSFARGDHVHPAQTSVTGNAGTATKFASAQSVALTGDVTGSASSQAGWSVATTLSNSGVTAGSYGQAENASPAHKGTFSVPYITVDAKGRVTAASTKTITLPADNNTTYTNESLGNGYGTCATEEGTTAKVVTLSNYALKINGYVSVKFTYAVPTSATMNINGKGAKNIFYKGAAITAGVIKAGDLATFIYDGTQYQLVAIDRWQADTAKSISGLSVSGKTITYTKVDGSTGTISTQDTTYSVATTSANGLMSKDMVTKLNGIAAGAEVNQNAFANVKVGSTTVAADAKQDTIEFVAGSNITITPDSSNDKITIAATDTIYTHPTSGATAGSYGNSSAQTPAYGGTFNVPYITVNAQGHITAISNQTVKIPASDKVTVTDNLTSTSTTAALSANQGRVLQTNKVDKIEDTTLATLLDEIFGVATADEE